MENNKKNKESVTFLMDLWSYEATESGLQIWF